MAVFRCNYSLSSLKIALLWTAIQHCDSTLTSIDLSINHLSVLPSDQWSSFSKAIQGSKLTSLDLSVNHLFELSIDQWNSLGQAIQSSKLKSLRLSENDLSKLDAEQWVSFNQAIQSSTLASLDLSINHLSGISAGQWISFGQAIQGSNLKSLDLSMNYLSKLTDNRWVSFIQAIQNSKLTTLNMTGYFDTLIGESQTQQLSTALENNLYLINIQGVSENSKLISILKRNQALLEIRKSAEYILNRHESNFEECSAIINKLSETIQQLAKNSSLHAEVIHLELTILQDGLLWKKYNRYFIEKYPAEVDLINEVLLAISFHSPLYKKAYFEAFQLVYTNKRIDESCLIAFMEALPCCLDEGNKFIKFEEMENKIFDNILLEAAGFCPTLGNISFLSEIHRVRLMQYVFLCYKSRELSVLDKSNFHTRFNQYWNEICSHSSDIDEENREERYYQLQLNKSWKESTSTSFSSHVDKTNVIFVFDAILYLVEELNTKYYQSLKVMFNTLIKKLMEGKDNLLEKFKALQIKVDNFNSSEQEDKNWDKFVEENTQGQYFENRKLSELLKNIMRPSNQEIDKKQEIDEAHCQDVAFERPPQPKIDNKNHKAVAQNTPLGLCPVLVDLQARLKSLDEKIDKYIASRTSRINNTRLGLFRRDNPSLTGKKYAQAQSLKIALAEIQRILDNDYSNIENQSSNLQMKYAKEIRDLLIRAKNENRQKEYSHWKFHCLLPTKSHLDQLLTESTKELKDWCVKYKIIIPEDIETNAVNITNSATQMKRSCH